MRLLLCLLTVASLQAQDLPRITFVDDDGKVPREHPVDMERMRLEVSFDTKLGLVRGKVTHVFRSLWKEVDGIYFDGVDLRIQDVRLNNQPVQYVSSDKGLTVLPPSPLVWGSRDSITITYEANPRKGLYFIGWNQDGPIRKQIWTQGQEIDHRHWIPLYDFQNDKMITETIITFDARYQVVSNGKKINEKTNKDGTKTWHYRLSNPHSSYLLMLAIGDYAVKTLKTRRGVPVNLYYYPEEPHHVTPTYRHTADIIDWLETETGVPYPWETFSNVPAQDFVTGAMENTTVVLLGDFWLVDSRADQDDPYWDTDAHEIAHQWFGDLITGRTNRHLWLQESFATFYSKRFARHVYGEDDYEWRRRQEHLTAIHADEANPVPIVNSRGDYARLYPKGSAVIDMMFYTFGEAECRRVITHFLNRFRYRNVETNDFLLAFEDTLGRSPHGFFEQWLYRAGVPHYDVSVQDIVTEGGRGERMTELTVRQIHSTSDVIGLFTMPIVVEIWYADGTKDSVRHTFSEAYEKINIPNTENKNVDFVLFDPGSVIMKRLTFPKTWESLAAQAVKAPRMIDRYDAVTAMSSFPLEQKRDLLKSVFRKESFYAIRSEVVRQLAYDVQSYDLMREALRDASVDVRHTASLSFGAIPVELELDFRPLLKDSSYVLAERVLRDLCKSFPDRAVQYLEVTKNDVGFRYSSRINWLSIKASLGDSTALSELTRFSGPSYEFRARRAAFNALKRLNHCDTDVIRYLCDAVLNPNDNLSGPIRTVANYFYEQTAFQKAIDAYIRSTVWEPWQLDILYTVF
jgi:aminopeptidase N